MAIKTEPSTKAPTATAFAVPAGAGGIGGAEAADSLSGALHDLELKGAQSKYISFQSHGGAERGHISLGPHGVQHKPPRESVHT